MPNNTLVMCDARPPKITTAVHWQPTEQEMQRFTEQDCHQLAREIHRRSGWALQAGYEHHRQCQNGHVAVRHPSGYLLDIEGLHADTSSYRDFYDVDRFITITEQQLVQEWQDGNTQPADEQVQAVAQRLIAAFR